MVIIKPITITDAVLTSSTVAETDYAAWSSATSYAVGARVIRTSTHRIYESLVASNLNNTPETNLTGTTPKWLDVGPTNRWAMLDASWSTQTTIATPLTVVLTPGAYINSLALLNISATSVTVSMVSGATTVYSKTVSLIDSSAISDWYTYYFNGFNYVSDLVLTDLPLYSNGVITVSLTAANGNVSCGALVLGSVYDIGDTQYHPSVGIIDYSTKTTDTFGNTTITKRKFSKRMTAKLELPNSRVDDIVKTLAAYRSTPIVWVGAYNLYTSLIIWGFYKDFEIDIAYPTLSYCSLTIEGMT